MFEHPCQDDHETARRLAKEVVRTLAKAWQLCIDHGQDAVRPVAKKLAEADKLCRDRAAAEQLRLIAPKVFTPDGAASLPLMHARRDSRAPYADAVKYRAGSWTGQDARLAGGFSPDEPVGRTLHQRHPDARPFDGSACGSRQNAEVEAAGLTKHAVQAESCATYRVLTSINAHGARLS